MRVVMYASRYAPMLEALVLEYFREMHPKDISPTADAFKMITEALQDGRTIYILVDNDDIPIGFLFVGLNSQYDMTVPYVFVEYMFVTKEQRTSLAVLYLFTMIGKICDEYGLDAIGTTHHHSNNIHNATRLQGVPSATTYIYPLEDIRGIYKRYNTRLNKGAT